MDQTLREIVEEALMRKYSSIKPHFPTEWATLRKYKDGTFGVSTTGIALYANGCNGRGQSRNRYGLIYENGESFFGVGYFKKEYDDLHDLGFLFCIAPRGKNGIEKAGEFAQEVISDISIPCQGVYLRFLTLDQYRFALQQGFDPIKESPWNPESPEEDETFSNAIIDLVAIENNRKFREGCRRFSNFLMRTGLAYRLEQLTPETIPTAQAIIVSHFEMLKQKGKAIGSTPEDHLNSLDPAIHQNPEVRGFIGYLDTTAVSIFVGETTAPGRFALYTPFTIRERGRVNLENLDDQEAVGFSALPIYAYSTLATQLRKEGFKELDLGGSELADLNSFKRKLGARPQPSYWAVKLR